MVSFINSDCEFVLIVLLFHGAFISALSDLIDPYFGIFGCICNRLTHLVLLFDTAAQILIQLRNVCLLVFKELITFNYCEVLIQLLHGDDLG